MVNPLTKRCGNEKRQNNGESLRGGAGISAGGIDVWGADIDHCAATFGIDVT